MPFNSWHASRSSLCSFDLVEDACAWITSSCLFTKISMFISWPISTALGGTLPGHKLCYSRHEKVGVCSIRCSKNFSLSVWHSFFQLALGYLGAILNRKMDNGGSIK